MVSTDESFLLPGGGPRRSRRCSRMGLTGLGLLVACTIALVVTHCRSRPSTLNSQQRIPMDNVDLTKYKDSRGPNWLMHQPDPFVMLQTPPRVRSFQDLPKKWDWRDYNGTGINLITPIGNQMSPHGCGSCWAFATTRALSDRLKIAQYLRTKKMPVDVVLSSQALLDCGMSSFGSCHGGDPRYAYKWIYEHGLVDETCSPYIAASPSWFAEGQDCASTQCHTCNIRGECFVVPNPTLYHIEEFNTFDGALDDDFILQVMSEVYFRGPIVVSMYAHSEEFETFKGGYVLRDRTEYPGTTHDVSIIGWGETSDGNVKYWIVRNSFGTQWGENGFFRVERGINAYNLETEGVWAVPKLPPL